MSKETAAILRSALYTAKTAKTIDEIQIAIEAMCDGEDIAHVAAMLARREKQAEAGKSVND